MDKRKLLLSHSYSQTRRFLHKQVKVGLLQILQKETHGAFVLSTLVIRREPSLSEQELYNPKFQDDNIKTHNLQEEIVSTNTTLIRSVHAESHATQTLPGIRTYGHLEWFHYELPVPLCPSFWDVLTNKEVSKSQEQSSPESEMNTKGKNNSYISVSPTLTISTSNNCINISHETKAKTRSSPFFINDYKCVNFEPLLTPYWKQEIFIPRPLKEAKYKIQWIVQYKKTVK